MKLESAIDDEGSGEDARSGRDGGGAPCGGVDVRASEDAAIEELGGRGAGEKREGRAWGCEEVAEEFDQIWIGFEEVTEDVEARGT